MSKFESIIEAKRLMFNVWYFGCLIVKGGLCGSPLWQNKKVKEYGCCFRFYHSKSFGYGIEYYTLKSKGNILESDNRLLDCDVNYKLDSEEISELNRLKAI